MTSTAHSPDLYGHFIVTETAAGRRFQFNHTLMRTAKNVSRIVVTGICAFFGFFLVMILIGAMNFPARAIPIVAADCLFRMAFFSAIAFGIAYAGCWLTGYRSKTSMEVRPDGLTINDSAFIGGGDISVRPFVKEGKMGQVEQFSIILTAGIRRLEILDIEPDAFTAFTKQFNAACRQIWHLENA